VLLRGDHVLMVRLERPGRGFWVLPGGAVEDGETPAEAAVREVREETGLMVALDRLLFVDGPRSDGEVVIRSPRYTFLGRILAGEVHPDLSEVAAVAWMPLDAMEFDARTADTMRLVRASLAES
jgi:ADP-ribose pyrophosphatase YjhB (NUDIX family)